jgi:hypothetical protein
MQKVRAMKLVRYSRPKRALIRCKAKMQLQDDPIFDHPGALDDGLLRELAETLFCSRFYRDLYRPYASREEASAVENQAANELAKTYKQIKLRQQSSLVQQLNSLLSGRSQ